MKKEYVSPVIVDLGEIMDMTKGVGGFGFNDFFRVDLFCDGDADTHPFASNPLSTS